MFDPYIGQITLFAGNFAPRGWAFCDGQLLSIAQNTTTLMASGDDAASQPHNNMQPFLGLNFIIALEGIFPSRD